MRNRFRGVMVAAALAAVAMISVSVTGTAGQASRPVRTVDDKPNFSGIWQANNEAHWDLQAHAARPGMVMQQGVYPYPYAMVPAAPVMALGAAAGVPGSIGVVQGDGQIPYTPEAAAIKQENAEHWIDRDPELKCYLPGIPRAMYMPYPFQIVQSTNKIQMAYAFTSTARTIHLDDVEGPPDDTFMGHSVGRWEGDTFVVDVTAFPGPFRRLHKKTRADASICNLQKQRISNRRSDSTSSCNPLSQCRRIAQSSRYQPKLVRDLARLFQGPCLL